MLSANSFSHLTLSKLYFIHRAHAYYRDQWNSSLRHTLLSTYHRCSRGVSWWGWCHWAVARGPAWAGTVSAAGACWPVWHPRCRAQSQTPCGCYNREKKNNGFVILSHEYSRSNYTHRAPTDLSEATSDKATMSLCNFQINREVKQAPGMWWHPQNTRSKLRGLAFTFEQTSELGQPLYKCHDSLVWTWLNWIKGS